MTRNERRVRTVSRRIRGRLVFKNDIPYCTKTIGGTVYGVKSGGKVFEVSYPFPKDTDAKLAFFTYKELVDYFDEKVVFHSLTKSWGEDSSIN